MAREPLHICLLTYRGNPQSGGQGIYVGLLSRELAAMGHRVDVWSGQPYPELDDGIGLVKLPSLDLWNLENYHRTPSLAELRDPINLSEWITTRLGSLAEPRDFCRRVARRFEREGCAERYDIIHDNQSLGSALLRLRHQLPIVATIHHPVTRDRKLAFESAPTLVKRYGVWSWYRFLPMQMRVARRMDRILTVSEAAAGDLATDYGIPRDHIRVVGNGINIDVFEPRPAIARRTDRLITTISADMPLKGFTYLLDALAELRRTRPNVELTVIGCSDPRRATMDKIRRLGLERAVHFKGRVAAEEIADAYAEASVAVVASLYEGFGFPAGEAMACEVPVVSTRGGALPEVVGESGKAGLLVEAGRSDELARAIAELLDAPEQRRREMGRAGRRRVLEQFTWRRAAERTVDNYREAIAAHDTSQELAPGASLRPRTDWSETLAPGPGTTLADIDTAGPDARIETC